MRVIAEETWSWMLFGDESDLFLSVLCGSIAHYTVDFSLSPVEAEQFSRDGTSYISDLARAVRSNPANFQERNIVTFNRLPGISEATGAWRTAKSAEA